MFANLPQLQSHCLHYREASDLKPGVLAKSQADNYKEAEVGRRFDGKRLESGMRDL